MVTQEEYDQYKMQESLQQKGVEGGMVPYTHQMQQDVAQSQAVLVQQTNPIKVLIEIANKLKGYYINPDKSITKISEPLMNKKGISRIMFIMSSIINQNTILSHLEEKEISKIVIQLSDDLTDDLTLNWREYEITDKMMLDHILDAIIFPAYFALKRALGQNEKNWLGKISVEQISGAPRIQPPKKGGFWSKLRL